MKDMSYHPRSAAGIAVRPSRVILAGKSGGVSARGKSRRAFAEKLQFPIRRYGTDRIGKFDQGVDVELFGARICGETEALE
jgi:hypothetical protein